MNLFALLAVTVSWSVFHPVWPDLASFEKIVARADAYGGVDSFEACGRCGSPNGGLNGFLLYEPYPSAAREVDREWVARNVKTMNAIVSASHKSGRPFYYWHREVFMPKGVLRDVPEMRDADGEFDLLGEPYAKYLRWKIGAAFKAVPDLDGIVLTLTEADFSVIHNSNRDRYPPVRVVERLVRIFAEEHERLGKTLIVRSFGSIAPDYEDIIAGAKAAAADHRFEIETKVTAYDFDPFLPNNPFLRKTPGTTLGAECDGLGEYFGAGYFPAAQVPVVRRYVDDARRQGTDRFTIRIDRVGNSIFDSAQEINLYAYMRFIRDERATADQVTDEWAKKRWAKCPAEMKRLAALGFDAVKHTQFVDESVAFHQNPPSPNFKYVKSCGIFSIFRDGFDLRQTERMWGMLSDRRTPGRKAILAEKDQAVAEAEEGYALVRTLEGRLDAGEYARHLRAWRNLAAVAKATREYFRCACAYFDDMDANAADAPRLTAASAAAWKAISALMKDPDREIGGYQDECSPTGEDMDVSYLFPLRWFCREFLREYRAEFAARQKFLGRNDVVDFVIPGGMYDDVRTWRTAMHASYQDVDSGVPVRYAGNGIFPNGAVSVEFKDVEDAVLEIDVDPERGATDYALEDVTTNGVRRVTISKKGAAYPAIRSIALVRRPPSGPAASAASPLIYPPADILAYAQSLEPKLTEIRRDLHRHPELAFEEVRTTAKIREVLSGLPGIEIREIPLRTGVVAELKGTKPELGTIGLRCDIDALPIQEEKPASHAYKSETPGKMHACGHDGHIAINLGAAMVLSKFRPEHGVRFIFQPAEETIPCGAPEMIRAGAADGLKMLWGFHINATSDFGNVGWYDGIVMAGGMDFEIAVTGRSVHVSYPDRSVNPIVVLSRIAVELDGIKQSIRATRPWSITLCHVKSGDMDNAKSVSPATGVLFGKVYYHEPEVKEHIRAKVESVAKAFCGLYGATCSVRFEDGLAPTLNLPELGPVVRENAAALGLPLEHIFASMGGDDFGFYGWKVPAYYMTFGLRTSPDFPIAHTSKFDFDERVLPSAAAMFASCALRRNYPELGK